MKTVEDVFEHTASVQLGINSCLYSEHYMQAAEASGIMVRTPYEIRKSGWERIIAEAVRHATAATDGIYVSVDIDCIDQSCVQGTSVPNASGLFPYEVMDAVFEISQAARVVGLDITEVSPPLDSVNFSAQVGAHIIMNYMAGVVARESGGTGRKHL
jgi:agmatinase